ncbi:hypothetical protein V6Z11_A02G010200 [Gossypium hirsutum]
MQGCSISKFLRLRVECYSHMKSLEKADICIYGFHSNLSIDATHLIQGICNIRSLSLSIHEVIFGTSLTSYILQPC